MERSSSLRKLSKQGAAFSALPAGILSTLWRRLPLRAESWARPPKQKRCCKRSVDLNNPKKKASYSEAQSEPMFPPLAHHRPAHRPAPGWTIYRLAYLAKRYSSPLTAECVRGVLFQWALPLLLAGFHRYRRACRTGDTAHRHGKRNVPVRCVWRDLNVQLIEAAD